MNRGQAPQRPPNLGPNQPQAMSNAFRSPYNASGFAMNLQRQVPGVLQGYPTVPNHTLAHRTQQPQSSFGAPSPSIFSQRSAVTGGFPFGMGLVQQQQQQQHPGQQGSSASLPPHLQHQSSQSTTPQQSQQQPPQQQQSPQTLQQQAQQLPSSLPIQQQQQQQHPPSQTPSQDPGHSTSPSNGQPTSTTNEQGLDPLEFPALSSGTNGASGGSSTGTGPVQTPVLPPNLPSSYASQAGTGLPMTGGAPGLSNQNTNREFGPEDFPALGGTSIATSSGQEAHTNVNGTIGLQDGIRRAGSAYSTEPDSRKFSLKTAVSNPSWTSPSPNPVAPQPTTTPGGPFSSTILTNGTSSHQGPNSLGGAQPLSNSLFTGLNHTGTAPNPLSLTTGLGPSADSSSNANGIPQTPAQQVLMSPADRWGLLGLLALIRSADPEATLLGIGTDLGTMGLDMQTQGNLYSTFITPWSDSSAAHLVEPDFHLPACYNVQPAPLTPNKAVAFSDETLFFMFYTHPRDMLQEIAAQELWNRNWRYHKDLRVWLTKETGTSPSQKQPGGELGMFTIWDSENWEKTRKRIQVAYSDLEEKATPAFPNAGSVQIGGVSSQHQQQQQRESSSSTTPGGIPVGRFAGMGMSVGA